jgi:hypothetical protein
MSGNKTLDEIKRDLQVQGVHIMRVAGSPYGGQPHVEVRKNGVFYYYIGEWQANQLETEGVIDHLGYPRVPA